MSDGVGSERVGSEGIGGRGGGDSSGVEDAREASEATGADGHSGTSRVMAMLQARPLSCDIAAMGTEKMVPALHELRSAGISAREGRVRKEILQQLSSLLNEYDQQYQFDLALAAYTAPNGLVQGCAQMGGLGPIRFGHMRWPS